MSATAALVMLCGGARSETLLDRWNIHPKYSTSYGVNRTRRTWDQRFNLQRKIGGFTLKNVASIRKISDVAQNDFSQGHASNKLSLSSRWRGWSMGLDVDLQWDRSENIYTTRRDKDTVVGMRLERTVSVPFLDPVEFSGSSGYAHEADFGRRELGGQQGTRRDSTLARGTDWGFELNTNGELARGLTYTARAGFSGTDQKSDTHSFLGSELTGVVEDDNTDRKRDLNLTGTWDSEGSWKAGATAGYIHTQFENFDLEEGQKETKLGTAYLFKGSLEGDLREGLRLSAEATHDQQDVDFRVKDRDLYRVRRTLKSDIRYEPELPILRGSTIRNEWEITQERNEREGSKFYDTRRRDAKLIVDRPLAKSVTLKLTGQLYLSQDIYDDGTLDKDELRTLVDGSLSYQPSRTFSARVSYQRKDTEIINIRADRATGNNTVQSNRVTASYQLDLGRLATLRQNFSISADYTFYSFTETNNTLRRNNEVKTTIEPGLGPNITLKLEHLYRAGDVGGYGRRESDGRFVYRPGTETLRQYLILSAEYRIRQAVTLKATQSFDADHRLTLVSGRRTTTERAEFSGEARFQHEFSKEFSFQGSFRRTQSTAEDDYWIVEASLNRDF